ncbi:hypothetical protein HanPI659440_Chr17g0665201 [Helianthus annuus]|nr:hypothetical protein HanPI659440_Chr17g0665201 [Helianthus annuus]
MGWVIQTLLACCEQEQHQKLLACCEQEQRHMLIPKFRFPNITSEDSELKRSVRLVLLAYCVKLLVC